MYSKIIARDLRLVASRLYRMSVTRPWSRAAITDEINYGRQQIMNGQYIKMSVNGESTICGLVSTVIHQ